MLAEAGLEVRIDPADFDEGEAKRCCAAEGLDADATTRRLGRGKAMQVSARHPGAWVIGADQSLDCKGVWFDKPTDRVTAAAQLRTLRGQKHTLISAVVVVRDGVECWGHVDRARLVMRDFSDVFLETYLDRAGDAVLGSVGAYQLEGLGVQLFDQVEGDVFTILGLPLLPLLGFLRDCAEIGR
jgi:septum formation protein